MKLEWKDDLDLDMIAESGQCFRWQKTGQEGEYRIPFRRELLYIRRIDDTHFDLSCTERQFERTWRLYFDLGRCYRDIRSMVCEEEDPVLYRAQQLGAGIRVLEQDPWEMLITFIISQRKNIPAIRLAVEKLARAAGDPLEGRNGEIVWSFPTAEQIAGMSEQALAEVKLGVPGKICAESGGRRCRRKNLSERNGTDGSGILRESAAGNIRSRPESGGLCGAVRTASAGCIPPGCLD